MDDIRRDLKSFDFLLAFLVIALGIFGIIMVGSTTGLGNGVFSSVFINQIIFFVTGIGIMLIMAFVNYEFIAKFYIPIYIVNFALLVLVLVLPNTRGVSRWLGVEIAGIEFGIQPSEFTKIFMVIFLAKFIDKFQERINNILLLGLVVGSTMLPVILILAQPSLSAPIVTIVIMLGLLYTGKISYIHIIAAVVIAIPVILFLFVDLHRTQPIIMDISENYQLGRIWFFLYPELDVDFAHTYQNVRAIEAFNAGELMGRGLFNNPIRVPEGTNDFIFAVIGAELGFIGSVVVVFIVLIIALRCMMIAHRSDVFLGRLIAAGIAVAIAFQSFTHVAVNTWLMPNTGMSLPFVSSGGSAMWVFMAMTGLVLNVGMTRSKSMFEEF